MQKLMYILLSVIILGALPSCCGCNKKKNAKEVTINREDNTLSMEFVGTEPATETTQEEVVENSKF
jgi:hypothetical protein